jgi:TolA-binding protein
MAYLKLDEEKKAVKPLKIAHEIENNNLKKARYLYILGQILEKQSNKDSANVFFKKVIQFNRKIPRELFVNAKLKTLSLGSLENDKKESQFKKMIENYENEDFLDKIFFNYSMFLFSKNSNDLAKIYLNKAVKENSNDKELLYRAFIKMSKIYFENSDYLIAGKYLDSTLNNLDKKSKKFWEIQRQKKGISQIIQLENNINLYDSLIKISFYGSEKLNNILKEIERNKTQIKVDDEKQEKINMQTTGFKSKSKKSNFYFYNDNLVALGKNSFETLWGVRVKQTYWRNPISSQTSQVKLSEKAINEKETNQTESFVSDEKSNLLSSIPRTKVQKDSIFNLKNDSYLRLAELYLVKYKDFGSAESRLKKVINSDPKQNFVAEANYLLYKLYKQQGLKTAEEIKSKIINNHPSSKFSKILQNANSLVVEEEFLIKKLDSLQTLFKEQKFNLVINEIDKQLNLIESQKISVDYELLKAASYGRLEGILYYGEMLKEIINKYPNSPRADELKGISKEINKKWKLKKDNEKSGKHLLVYIVDSESLNQEVLGKIKNVLDNSKRVSFDVYNQTTNFLVIGDFLNLENANKSRGFLEKKIELLKLNNNFVVLSSQYKNMLIYKTLDLFIK